MTGRAQSQLLHASVVAMLTISRRVVGRTLSRCWAPLPTATRDAKSHGTRLCIIDSRCVSTLSGPVIRRSQHNPQLVDLTRAGPTFHPEGLVVIPDAISQEEHDALVEDVRGPLRRMRLELNHFDSVIRGYKEITFSKWALPGSQTVIARVLASDLFAPGTQLHPNQHVLELAPSGYIAPHIDNVEACGEYVAGISLLSASVMRFTYKDEEVRILLEPRSIYCMSHAMRYKFKHSIVCNSSPPEIFGSRSIVRDRRISVLFRDQPKPVPPEMMSDETDP
ncbi:hypothetical protein CAOG_01081 [Capsaspora owczarzaki ATCC 30864]|uniref:Alpha-ketoglutarate-dependent dioxygenase AlkB-like domain-containing protein n=1 Tax=Capsaspora owczarzaki (strain ATCC 30864) TaxID=595528 RepID=A0A0D2X0U0_CAPO3|nr:hypothetical protein CAOG_01081 [Capsaspora owczarzaki ATCC 30864]KJE89644.1 hypothetical protein CAOG_001081 [Capsaspora owczarzaki ATCC 30864]|eukprot:XP_004365952.1 hypothetical protein CAOG_01081 [Capsaspora owczarzaki ATCC 30864]